MINACIKFIIEKHVHITLYVHDIARGITREGQPSSPLALA